MYKYLWLFTNAMGDIQMHKQIYKRSRTFTNVVEHF